MAAKVGRQYFPQEHIPLGFSLGVLKAPQTRLGSARCFGAFPLRGFLSSESTVGFFYKNQLSVKDF